MRKRKFLLATNSLPREESRERGVWRDLRRGKRVREETEGEEGEGEKGEQGEGSSKERRREKSVQVVITRDDTGHQVSMLSSKISWALKPEFLDLNKARWINLA